MRQAVKLMVMAPQFVNSYVKTIKNDVADAQAICNAVQWNHVAGQQMSRCPRRLLVHLRRLAIHALMPVADLRLGQPPPFLFKFDRLRP